MQLIRIGALWAVALVSTNQGIASAETRALRMSSHEDYVAMVDKVQREMHEELRASRDLGNDFAIKEAALRKIVGTTKMMQGNLEVLKRELVEGRRSLEPVTLVGIGSAIGGLATATNAFATLASTIFDRTYLDRAADFIAERYAQFEQVVADEGSDLVSDIAVAASTLNDTESSVNEISGTARRQGVTLRIVLDRIEPGSVLYDFEEDEPTQAGLIFEATIRLLITNLQTFNARATEAIVIFSGLAAEGNRIKVRSDFIAQRFVRASRTGSPVLQRAIESQRARAYGTCGAICGVTCLASISLLVLQPIICGSCVGACYGIAAGIVEGEVIPGLQADFEIASENLLEFGRIFDNFTSVASVIAERASFSASFTRTSRGTLEELQSRLELGSDVRIADVFLDVTSKAVDSVIEAAANVERNLLSSDRPNARDLPPLPEVQTPDDDRLAVLLRDNEKDLRDMGNDGGDPELVIGNGRRLQVRGASQAVEVSSTRKALPPGVVTDLQKIKSIKVRTPNKELAEKDIDAVGDILLSVGMERALCKDIIAQIKSKLNM